MRLTRKVKVITTERAKAIVERGSGEAEAGAALCLTRPFVSLAFPPKQPPRRAVSAEEECGDPASSPDWPFWRERLRSGCGFCRGENQHVQ